MEAVVGIGAELVTVAVRQDGVPKFVRTVALAGSPRPQALSEPSTGAGSVTRGKGAGVLALPSRTEAIANEVRSSLEYLLTQSGTSGFQRVLITGGGAMLPGVAEMLSTAVGLPISLADPAIELDHDALALEGDVLKEASYRWLTAVGLALWGTDAYGKPSLLPPEVLVKRQQRRVLAGAGVVVLVVGAALGVRSYEEVKSADHVSSEIRAADVSASLLQKKINSLGYVLQVPADVAARRQLAVEALSGDINWLGMERRIRAALPADVTPQQITLNKISAGPSAAGAAAQIVGGLAMTAETTGGAHAVARFIDQVSQVTGLAALWVSSTTNSQGVTTIQATADLTVGALSNRAALLPGGGSK